ncbi:hypothetical protein SARC_06843 [Sphaeroforma arctica JP610]|uniref:Uncharacterized protein n=1 Tax=Sphaeroforma arctica JP610 TaxID=667725 RepID=A0A0L0FW60_9EUKA|nr:hypothetical protein SARC_06843 [Sphaeroforma arctica JP610]KNC80806.1 hypothetical protein SARC_06843 [Sphaeroforma arctica JP610]|eukprot:XP_014154708.1 hypothetical protein SARC_06843 [Sphaeroforma arctica JP610]
MYGIIEPRVRLEVMNKYQILFILVVTYIAVVLASLSVVYEIRLGTAEIPQSGESCNSSQISARQLGLTSLISDRSNKKAIRKDAYVGADSPRTRHGDISSYVQNGGALMRGTYNYNLVRNMPETPTHSRGLESRLIRTPRTLTRTRDAFEHTALGSSGVYNNRQAHKYQLPSDETPEIISEGDAAGTVQEPTSDDEDMVEMIISEDSGENEDFKPCTDVREGWILWSGRLPKWSVLYGLFGLMVDINVPANHPPLDIVLPYTVDVYAAEEEHQLLRLVRRIGHKQVRFHCDSTDSRRRSLNVPERATQPESGVNVNGSLLEVNGSYTGPNSILIRNTNASDASELERLPNNAKQRVLCTSADVFAKSELSCYNCRNRMADFKVFEVRVNYTVSVDRVKDIEMLHGLLLANSFTYKFTYSRLLYRTTEIVIRAVMLVVTFAMLVIYIHQLIASPPRFFESLPEQRYVISLLVATVMYQNPLSIPILVTGNYTCFLVGEMLTVTAIAILMATYLFIFDCIHLLRDDDRSVVFYMPKLVFACSYWVTGMLLLYLRIFNYDQDVQEFDVDSLVMEFVIAMEYCKIVMKVVWTVWMFAIIVNTRSYLEPMPYLRTRFRQLPFRYFILQGWCVMIFFIVIIIRGLIAKSLFDVSKTAPLLGVVFIITVYNILLALIYLPPKRYPLLCCCRRKSERGCFKRGLRRRDALVEDYELLHEGLRSDNSSTDELSPTTSITDLSTDFLQRVPSLSQAVPSFDDFMTFMSGSDRESQTQLREKRKPKVRYSPLLASFLLKYSIQAYYDPPDRDTASGWGKINSELSVVGFISDNAVDSHVLVARRDRFLVVAFRGTSSKVNWESNLKFNQMPLPVGINPTTTMSSYFVPKVHRGFWLAYAGLRERLLDLLRNYLTDPINCYEVNTGSGRMQSDLELLVTGHSLGGALATFAAYELSLHLQMSVQLYTFGSPRTGNQFWGMYFDAAVPNSYRVVYDGDIVTGVPMKILLYRHVGTQVVVERHGNTIISPTFVERVFRSRRKRGINAHMCGSYEAALTSCVREIIGYLTEKDSMDDISTLRTMRYSGSFTDGELCMLAGLRRTPVTEDDFEMEHAGLSPNAYRSALHRTREEERHELQEVVRNAEASWSVYRIVTQRITRSLNLIRNMFSGENISDYDQLLPMDTWDEDNDNIAKHTPINLNDQERDYDDVELDSDRVHHDYLTATRTSSDSTRFSERSLSANSNSEYKMNHISVSVPHQLDIYDDRLGYTGSSSSRPPSAIGHDQRHTQSRPHAVPDMSLLGSQRHARPASSLKNQAPDTGGRIPAWKRSESEEGYSERSVKLFSSTSMGHTPTSKRASEAYLSPHSGFAASNRSFANSSNSSFVNSVVSRRCGSHKMLRWPCNPLELSESDSEPEADEHDSILESEIPRSSEFSTMPNGSRTLSQAGTDFLHNLANFRSDSKEEQDLDDSVNPEAKLMAGDDWDLDNFDSTGGIETQASHIRPDIDMDLSTLNWNGDGETKDSHAGDANS